MDAAGRTIPTSATAPTVLVVVGEVLVRMAVAAYLRECKFRVVETGSAEEAIEVLQVELAIDIVLSDVHLPGSMDGFGLAQWLRRERPDLKIILTSGAARTAKVAGHLCVDGPLLAEPYEHGRLAIRIRELLERQVPT